MNNIHIRRKTYLNSNKWKFTLVLCQFGLELPFVCAYDIYFAICNEYISFGVSVRNEFMCEFRRAIYFLGKLSCDVFTNTLRNETR